MAIGIELESESLVLTRGRDFRWAFQNLDENGQPEDFPAGDLYFEFPYVLDGGDPVTWPFTIDGDTASIKVESTEVDDLPTRGVKWHLVWLPDGEAAGGDPVAIGTVTLQGA